MQNRIVWVIVGCLTVAALVLASCGPAVVEEEEEAQKTGPQYGGLINTSYGSVENWDPSGPILWPEQLLQYNIYQPFGMADWSRGSAGTGEIDFGVTYVSEKYFIPLLAESWEIPNLTTYIFHLRQGIHYHDKPPANGREVVADDAVFTYQRTAKVCPGTQFRTTQGDKIYARDKYTVVIELSEPKFQGLRGMVWHNFIYPPEIVGEDGKVDWKNNCGTGPYILADVVRGSSARLTRNLDYWQYDPLYPENKLPYVDEIKLLIIPEISTRLAALRTGKVDRLSDLTPEQAEELAETNPDLLQSHAPGAGEDLLFLRADLKPFDDIRVRRALAMAIDRQAIARDYYKGKAILPAAPIGYSAAWTPLEELPQELQELYEYNPEKAKQLLAEAGYPDGFKTDTLLMSDYQDLLLMVKNYWEAIGVITEANIQERGAHHGMMNARKYETCFSGSVSSPDTIVNIDWWPYSIQARFWGLNEEGKGTTWYDPEIVELQTEIKQTVDEDKQMQLLKKLNILIMGRVYYIDMPLAHSYNVWQPWLKGYHGELGLGQPFATEGFWWLCWVDQDLKESMAGKR